MILCNIVGYFFRKTGWTIQLQILRQEVKQLWRSVEECMHIAFREATSRAMVHALEPPVTSQRRILYSNPNKDQSQLRPRWRRCLAHHCTTNMSGQSRDNTAYHWKLLLDSGELYHEWPLGWWSQRSWVVSRTCRMVGDQQRRGLPRQLARTARQSRQGWFFAAEMMSWEETVLDKVDSTCSLLSLGHQLVSPTNYWLIKASIL